MLPIALITDFGEKDWFAAVMKAVIYSINPKAKIIDVTHEISPQNVNEAAFVLWNASRQFPSKTLFVTVVDPGVGSGRKIIAVKTDNHIFLAPDNGVTGMALSGSRIIKSVHVENHKFFRHTVSRTFHGRDIFAPVAAHLSKGLALQQLGSPAPYIPEQTPFVDATRPGRYRGRILYIDRFGNLITNLKVPLRASGTAEIIPHQKGLKSRKIHLVSTYSDVRRGKLLAYPGSSGLLEIAVREGSAQQIIGATYSIPVYLKIG
ncbi:MAG TPA: SAM-dependent chlorinase/fluorinase [Chitinophagales bacterium]|nr:SAM-dependent chlorinase/fluorinase [Chitinophagales bacterium]